MASSIKNFYNKVRDKVSAIIEWRSTISPFYLFCVNILFWLSAFYVQQEYQLQILVFFAISILSYDILLTPTDENSVISHIFLWPFRSFFKTASFFLFCYSANELKEGDKEYACWAGYIALLFLLTNPVWVYNRTTEKIKNGISKSVDLCIITPLSKLYAAGYYICTFQFLKGLPSFINQQYRNFKKFIISIGNRTSLRLRKGYKYIASLMDYYLYQPMKNCTIKLKNFFYYWLFAGWWPSVAGYLDSHIGQPVKDRYNKLVEKVKYFIYGYWISPMGQKLKEILKDSALILLVFSKKMGIKIGILLKDTVIWPVLLWCYDIAIIPAYEVIKDKYRYVEDNVLIYFLAPVCQTVINVVPEKSPFVEDSDIELDDFLPSENDADSDASWDPYEDEKKRKEMEAALVAKKEKIKEKLAQIDLPDFNDLGSSDEEFMFDN